MSHTKFWLSAAIAVGFAVVTVCAQADTLRGNKSSCDRFATVVVQVSDLRDNGVPWEVMQAQAQTMIAEARSNPASFVQNDVDAAFVMASFKLLWDKPDEPAVVVANKVYERCMRSDAHYPVSKVKRVMV